MSILGVKKMATKTIKKTVYFYKTIPDYSLFSNEIDDPSMLQSMFRKCFPQLGEYRSKDMKIGIEIISSDEKHLFGRFLKEDEPKDEFLKLKVINNDNKEDLNQNVIFEYFSFFYIDINKCITSIISSIHSGKFTKMINQFLFQENFHIGFIPYSITSLDDALKKFKKVKGIEYVCNPSTSKETFRSLNQYQETESAEADKVTISVKFKHTGPQFINDLNKIESEKGKYLKYKISGESDDGTEQFFDILSKTFYRSAPIEIQGNPEENINFIKRKFQQEIELLYKEINS